LERKERGREYPAAAVVLNFQAKANNPLLCGIVCQNPPFCYPDNLSENLSVLYSKHQKVSSCAAMLPVTAKV
jgi:hypothetical protein